MAGGGPTSAAENSMRLPLPNTRLRVGLAVMGGGGDNDRGKDGGDDIDSIDGSSHTECAS